MLEVAEVWVCDGNGDSFLHCGCLPLRAAPLLLVSLQGLEGKEGGEVSPAVCALQQHTAGGVHVMVMGWMAEAVQAEQRRLVLWVMIDQVARDLAGRRTLNEPACLG
jgi:hypothetical protein